MKPKRQFSPDIIRTFTVQEPTTLTPFLAAVLPDMKRTALKEVLKHNSVMVNNNVTTQFNEPLSPGDTVSVNLSRSFVVFRHNRLKLVYEDDDVIVINKGYGLLSVGTGKANEETAYSILREYLKKKDPRNKIFVVHRLDQHTSGLMMFAKNIETKEALQHNWNNMVRKRQYVCLTEGRFDQKEGVIQSYLAENSQFQVYSTDNPEQGQLAYTRYKVLREAHGYSLVEVELETGRKHQIRVHMSDQGHPIAGDRRYGAKTSPLHRLALHAFSLHFIHPKTRKLLSFTTPIPAPFLHPLS